MAFTGQLGIVLSDPSNVVPGFGALPPAAPTPSPALTGLIGNIAPAAQYAAFQFAVGNNSGGQGYPGQTGLTGVWEDTGALYAAALWGNIQLGKGSSAAAPATQGTASKTITFTATFAPQTLQNAAKTITFTNTFVGRRVFSASFSNTVLIHPATSGTRPGSFSQTVTFTATFAPYVIVDPVVDIIDKLLRGGMTGGSI
jgi:hypothetical protein